MLVYDKSRGEIIDTGSGVVVEERIIDPGPEWSRYQPERRRCHVMYSGGHGSLWFFKNLVPRYVFEDAKHIMRRLRLGGRSGAFAAIMYSCKRYGVPLNNELLRLARAEKTRIYRAYRRILEELGPPPRSDEATVSLIIAVASRLGKTSIIPYAVKQYYLLRERFQGHKPSTLAAVALVKMGLPARRVAEQLNISPSTICKALKNMEEVRRG